MKSDTCFLIRYFLTYQLDILSAKTVLKYIASEEPIQKEVSILWIFLMH